MRDYRLYLTDILTAIESIEQFVAGMDLQGFKADDKTVSAVIRKFEIIGEAVKQLPEEIRQAYPEVPWKEMAGMRDRLIHFLFWRESSLSVEDDQRRFAQSEATNPADPGG